MYKTIIITGGNSGIGLACALTFGKANYIPIITGRNQINLQTASQLLTTHNIQHLAIQADVCNEAAMKNVCEKTIQQYGGIDILINNAGIGMNALFSEMTLDVFKKIMDTNFYGMVYTTKLCLPYIIQRKGTIVGVSSINGYRGTPARTAYSASKYAMNGFLEALRTEVMYKGVHVLVAAPGYTASNIRKNALTANGEIQGWSTRKEKKMMRSETVAKAIFKAIQQRKRTIVLTKKGKIAVFLNKWIPGYMDKITYRFMKKEVNSPLH